MQGRVGRPAAQATNSQAIGAITHTMDEPRRPSGHRVLGLRGASKSAGAWRQINTALYVTGCSAWFTSSRATSGNKELELAPATTAMLLLRSTLLDRCLSQRSPRSS